VPEIYLHLGSNIGNKEQHINSAVEMIEERVGEVKARSSFYTTEPWGVDDQEEYKNIAVHCNTVMSPETLLNAVLSIETALGRERKNRWGSRKIDIDIIFYGSETIVESKLIIPHRLMHKRNFVLVPLMEIAADFVHPTLGLTVEELYTSSEDLKDVYLESE